MGKAWKWIKEHPLIVVALIGGVVLLLLLLSSGGGSNTTAASSPGNSSGDALAAQQAHDQLSASTALAMQQGTNAAQLALAGIQANVQTYTTDRSADVQLSNIDASKEVNLAGIMAQLHLADLSAATNQAQIAANVDQAQLTAATYQHITDTTAMKDVRLAQINSDTQIETTKAYTSAQKHSSNNNLFGSIVGGLLSFL